MRSTRMSKNQGFTLIELIVVILVIAIIAVVATPRWTATSVSLEFEARQILNDIRYAQALSMTTGKRYRWVRLSSTTYQIVNEAGSPNVLPAGGTVFTLPNNIVFSTFTNLPNNLVAFDSQGTPYTDASIPGTALASVATITLSTSGQTRSVRINPPTGYGVLQ